MKLIVQIPCFNEEASLAQTVAQIPRIIPGVDKIEILVIDDGSTDRTAQVAREAGVDHIVRNRRNRGLARSFALGVDTALRLGADIVVNTDGDNQYFGADIPNLIQPILAGQAEFVVGDRGTATLSHFSPAKRFLQSLGSWVVRRLSGVPVHDAVSGFRAMSREAALRINIVSPFSYTIETLIQAGKKHIAIASVPVRTNPVERPSRLSSGAMNFIERSIVTMIRVYAMYQPLRYFFYIGTVLWIAGLIPIVRFLYLYSIDQGAGHIQSLILASVLIVMGFLSYLVGLLADLISFNRQLVEITLEKVRRIEVDVTTQHDHPRVGSTATSEHGPPRKSEAIKR